MVCDLSESLEKTARDIAVVVPSGSRGDEATGLSNLLDSLSVVAAKRFLNILKWGYPLRQPSVNTSRPPLKKTEAERQQGWRFPGRYGKQFVWIVLYYL